ncbi:hypothetical protein [Shewanella litorisediminis]|uniref:Secreted protein n=1 Tax=Shewanella litorisediminis TaxID=1173586 RepID=A0ABX7G7L0_9GAMM|nr:hypothetical protein [Shewanella litorisediminis]MCL2920142.1 hypothetical protein [Shewanella litorisediminis]QRH03256.1 hypothetical protein JQC75_07630 [Shewanella litorisediminis]
MKNPALLASRLAVSVMLSTTLLCGELLAAPSSLPSDSEVSTGQAPAPVDIVERVTLEAESPQKVFITVVKDGESTNFTLEGDELTDTALIDNKLSALDNESRADIIKTLQSIRSGKTRVISKGDIAELRALKVELKAREAEIAARSEAMSVRAEEMSKIGNTIAEIVMSSVQQIDLDEDGHRVMVLHHAGDNDLAMELHSVDSQAIQFRMLKELLSDSELTDEQREELKTMLGN